jgi:hypothetical protein
MTPTGSAVWSGSVWNIEMHVTCLCKAQDVGLCCAVCMLCSSLLVKGKNTQCYRNMLFCYVLQLKFVYNYKFLKL